VGGVQNADLQCLARVCKHPYICYDNDASNAGFKLVEKATELMSVHALTTPGPGSDLDSFIRSFGADHEKAWEAVQELIGSVKSYGRRYEAVADEIYRIRQKLDRSDFRRTHEIDSEVADAVRLDLAERGRFYYDIHSSYFMNDTTKQLVILQPDNAECQILLDKYGINATEKIYKYVIQDLYMKARRIGERTDVRYLSHYDQLKGTVYLYNHENQMYRIRSADIALVDNGTDGVLFLSNTANEPFVIGKEKPNTSLLDDLLISRINFAPDILSPDERRVIFTIWFYSLFFQSIMPTRPILAFIGEKGSGKTFTLRHVGKLLFGRAFDVMPVPAKPEDFDAAVTNSEFVAIDNADSKCRWLEDKLATVSTGGCISKRVLYTTNNHVNIPTRCNLAITARTPQFGRDDVADRSLILRVQRFEQMESEAELTRVLLENRDPIMTDVAYGIQEMLQALHASPGPIDCGQFRMADFAAFAIRIGRHNGQEEKMRSILAKLSNEQSAFALEGDPIGELLMEWAENNPGRPVSNAELCSELSTLAEKSGGAFEYRGNNRGFGQKMTHIRTNLEMFLDITEHPGRSRQKKYSYKLKDGAR